MKPQTWIYFAGSALLGLFLGALSTIHAQVRFDHVVRNDFFAGFTGNSDALERGMKVCEQVLAENPNHAEALVWHGAGLFFRSSVHFRAGDTAKGMELSNRGLAEMDKAVALAPDDIGVRIPRGAALLTAARLMSPEVPIRAGLFQRALDDHQHVYNLHGKRGEMGKLGAHPLGELLQALGDVHSRLGNAAQAEKFYTELLERLPGTPYAKRASAWLETKQPLPPREAQCIGCHTGN
jgi:tetratricopeptide (TPR) repeat protein